VEQWVCCQLGAREHYAVARALHRRGALDLLLTDAWVRPTNPLGMLGSGLRSRFHPELATASVYAPTARNAAFELRAKHTGLSKWPLVIARNEWFQHAVAARLSRVGPTGTSRNIMAYSYAALEIFKLARARGWRTVLGQIDPGPVEERIVTRLYDEAPAHQGSWRPAPQRYWSSWREECVLADRIVVNSLWSQAALLAEGVPAAKVRVVPLAYDETNPMGAFRREYPTAFTSARRLRALFLGQINLRKGLGPLLEAIRLARGEPIEFTFVGPIQLSIPADLRDHPKVRWMGSVAREDAARFYRDADVFLFPTFSDGFGLTQLEAQAWKLPVIATKFCGDVVEDGKNGFVLPEITPVSIVATLRRCLAEPARLQELSANCVSTKRFGLASIGEQWLRIFE
jgi:glycosyltransferase involved in cell wall biosynthesis